MKERNKERKRKSGCSATGRWGYRVGNGMNLCLEHKCIQAMPTCAANDNSAKEDYPSRLTAA